MSNLKDDDEGGENDVYEEIRLDDTDEKANWIHSLAETEGLFESPININLTYATPFDLQPIEWHHFEIPPKKVKLTNTGNTLTLSAKWYQDRPFVSGGPFLGNYVFSQLHFHWGRNNMEGSEHTIDGGQLPMEMHAVHFKSCYLTQESALKENDGITVLTYMFKLQSGPNPAIQILVDSMMLVQQPHCSIRLTSTPLMFFMRQFVEDYFLYWGSVTTSKCSHIILWLICREPIGISTDQIESFRSLLDANGELMLRNFRDVQPQGERKLFHISPGGSKYATLLPISKGQIEFFENMKI